MIVREKERGRELETVSFAMMRAMNNVAVFEFINTYVYSIESSLFSLNVFEMGGERGSFDRNNNRLRLSKFPRGGEGEGGWYNYVN